jgi:flagellar biosynthesis chaperone FliJ
MIRLGGLVSQKAFGKFEMGKVISNPFANAFVNEAEGSEDHEVSMANNSLDTIIKMATELKAKMGENEKDIPAWIQDHITNAENFISQASSNYHEYGQNEARIAEDKGPCWQGYKQVGMKDKGGRQVPNCVPNESVVKEISGRTPKIFVKTAAVEKKIKELMADRKKAVVPYNSEKDPTKKESLKQILIKLTKQIQGYEKNLIQLRDKEEEYIQQMNADAQLDVSAID